MQAAFLDRLRAELARWCEPERAWRACFAICCGLMVMPLWVCELPPLIDLPQHAAQISAGHHFWDAGSVSGQLYEFNWRVHQVIGYLAAWLLAFPLEVHVALKLVLTMSLLGIPWLTVRILRELEVDDWLVFFVFPIGYGFNFYWGFFHFIVGIPFGLALIYQAIRYTRDPGRRGAAYLAALAIATFLCHVLVVAYAGMTAAAIVLFGSRGWRARLLGLGALAMALPVVGAWLLTTHGDTPLLGQTEVGHGVYRLSRFFSYALGEQPRPHSFALGILLLLAPFIVGGRPTRTLWRWIPLLFVVASFYLLPGIYKGVFFIYERYSVFWLPALLIALASNRPVKKWGRPMAVLLPAAWLIFTTIRFAGFGVESRDAIHVIDQIPENQRVLCLSDKPSTDHVSWDAYLHFCNWYAGRHGGAVDFSFAMFAPNRFRYRADTYPHLPMAFEWYPHAFDWEEHNGAAYDYVLVQHAVRSDWDPMAQLPAGSEIVARRGNWYLVKPPDTERAL